MKEKQEIIKLRNHFTYIFEQMWSIMFLIVCILFGDGESIISGIKLIKKGNFFQGLLAMGGVLIMLLIICLWMVNRWYRTTITIQDGTITSTKATLNRRVNTIAIANISNINLEQNLFEMLVGTYKLKMDTNSLSTANSTDLEIVLKKKDAQEVKRLILMMLKEIQGNPQNDQKPEEFDVENGQYDLVYSTKEIIVNGLITTSIMEIILSIVLIISTVVTFVSIFQKETDIIVIFSTLFIQILAAGSIVFDVLKKWLMNFNFRARRDKNKIYVSQGLLRKKSYVVPVDKINAVSLRYSFIGRLCRRATVTVINVGGQGEDVDGMKLLLADTYLELERKLKILLPEFELPELDGLIKPPKRYMKLAGAYAFISALVLFGILLALCSFGLEGLSEMSAVAQVGICAAASLVVFAAVMYIRYLRYRAAGLFCGKDDLVISRGVFARTIQTIPYYRIQYIHQEQGPLQRIWGLMSGHISILASSLSQIQVIGTFEQKNFREIEENLKKTY